MARRHVAQAEEHVRKQLALIERLSADGHPLAEALHLLVEFESTLKDHRASVARIEDEQRAGRRDAGGYPVAFPDI